MCVDWSLKDDMGLPYYCHVKRILKLPLISLVLLLTRIVSPAESPTPVPVVAMPAFEFGAADVSSEALFMFLKPGLPLEVRLQVSVSNAKQAELARAIEDNPGRKIKIVVDGRTLQELEFKPAPASHSINITFASPDEAFAIARKLIPNSTAPANAPAASGPQSSPDALVFALVSNDVSKTVVLISKTDQPKLEVTFPKEKQEELARIAVESAADHKRVKVTLNGKVVSESDPFPPSTAEHPVHTGHSIKVKYDSTEEAFEAAKALMRHNAVD